MVAWQVGDAGLEAVGTVAGLRVLGLAGCLRVTDAGLIPLLRLDALEELSLAACSSQAQVIGSILRLYMSQKS